MVDLVKVRKKAKEKKKADEISQAADESVASAEAAGESAEVEERAEAAPVDSPRQEAPVVEERNDQPPPPPPLKVTAAAAPDPDEERPREERKKPVGHEKLEEFKRTANLQQQAVKAHTATQELVDSDLFELLLFRIAGEQYALPIEKIVEIIPPRSATRVPNTEETIVGIISLRGTIVSLLDIRRKLGHPPLEKTDEDSRIIVLENAGETAGFLVDRVSRVVRIDPRQIESHPVVSASEQSEYIRGVFQQAQKLSILLDLDTLLRF
jgi:purine-binding chemotaxis protein CheW